MWYGIIRQNSDIIIVIKRKQFKTKKEDPMLPQDPVMLLSYLNTQLRDNYGSLESLAEGLDIPESDLNNIVKKLSETGYTYDSNTNQFR